MNNSNIKNPYTTKRVVYVYSITKIIKNLYLKGNCDQILFNEGLQNTYLRRVPK